jgi:uncharacterized membrane protein required for colicin V production
MNSLASSAAGSPIWQLVFISFAVILVLFEILRGWRRGVARQLVRLGGLVAAYFAGFYCGQLIVPMLRPFVTLPDFALSILSGAALALIVYGAVNALGTIFFRRTNQHDSTWIRLLCGAGGAVLGILFGVFLVWLVAVGVRSVGAVADAQVREQPVSPAAARAQAIHAVDVRRGVLSEPSDDSNALVSSLARLKNSIELGVIGDVVKKVDVLPASVYDTLGKLGQVSANPKNAERFLSFPGATKLSENPKIVALRNDPDISSMIAQGRYLDLLQNEKIIDAANDEGLKAEVKSFDLRAALNYALQQNP